MRLGYFLSSEETSPPELVRQAQMAEEAGFDGLWISDHFHPWNDAQGHSPFVWAVLGAIAHATSRVRVTTAVTCPTVRMHPAIVAHAAATSAILLDGRFALGVGSGEALNEHILGDRWPEADVRLEMLEEAVEVIRGLFSGGMYSHHGRHYTVENACLYDLPEQQPPILVSGFGRKSIKLAARIGDGFCSTHPDREDVELYRSSGGGERPAAAGTKVCWGEDEHKARATAHRLWANEELPGELAQVLPLPADFEAGAELVSEEMVAEAIPCGPDIDRHFESLDEYRQAGYDELYVQQIGGDHERFFDVYAREILPRLREADGAADERPRQHEHAGAG